MRDPRICGVKWLTCASRLLAVRSKPLACCHVTVPWSARLLAKFYWPSNTAKITKPRGDLFLSEALGFSLINSYWQSQRTHLARRIWLTYCPTLPVNYMFTWAWNEWCQSVSCHELQRWCPACPSCQTQTDCVISEGNPDRSSCHYVAKAGCNPRQSPCITEAVLLRKNNRTKAFCSRPTLNCLCQYLSWVNAWHCSKTKIFYSMWLPCFLLIIFGLFLSSVHFTLNSLLQQNLSKSLQHFSTLVVCPIYVGFCCTVKNKTNGNRSKLDMDLKHTSFKVWFHQFVSNTVLRQSMLPERRDSSRFSWHARGTVPTCIMMYKWRAAAAVDSHHVRSRHW